MTIAPPARSVSAPSPRTALARIEIAWTASAGVLQGKSCYASAALHLECEWPAAAAHPYATCSATIDRAGVRTSVAITAPIAVDVDGPPRPEDPVWIEAMHVRVTTAVQTLLDELRATRTTPSGG